MDETQEDLDDGQVKIPHDEMYPLNYAELRQKQGVGVTATFSTGGQELAELHSDDHAGKHALSLEHGGHQQEPKHASHSTQPLQDSVRDCQQSRVSAGQSRAEVHALRDGTEEEQMVQLTGTVQELRNQLREEGQHLWDRYTAESSTCERQLPILGAEGENNLVQLARNHKAAGQSLSRPHRGQIQQHLETCQTPGDHFYRCFNSPPENLTMTNSRQDYMDQEEAGEHWENRDKDQDRGDSFTSSQDHLLEKYLVSAALTDSCWVEDSLLEDVGNYRFQLSCRDSLDGSASLNSDSQDLDGSSSEEVDLGKALLVQQCRDLATQLEDREKELEDRERQLEALRDETRGSVAELQEALEKRDEAMKTLESTQHHLEAERVRRLQCEEVIRRETQEADDLRTKLSYLQSQLEGKEHGQEETLGLITELREEKELLLFQLRGQEQLVRDVQEQKLAGDSVTSEVQTLFGRQLSILQEQRDHLQGMLDLQQAKNLTASELLGQRTLELDSSLQQVQHLQAQLVEREEDMLRTGKEKQELESRLLCLQENLVKAEQALSQGVEERAAQESRMVELEIRTKNTENALETAQAGLQSQLKAKDLELQTLTAEREMAEVEHQQKVSTLLAELASVRESLREQDSVHAAAMETLLRDEAEKLHSAVEEAVAQQRGVHQEEAGRLREKHQEQVIELTEEMQRKQSEMVEEQKSRIALIKQVHERERQREMAELASEREAELRRLGAELKESMEAAHQAELMQAQTQHALELEALRLSLTNQHAAQLELCQSAQQSRTEVALSELQESLSAQLNSEQQAQLQRVRDENQDQARLLQQQHQQEKDDLNQAWEARMLKEKVQMEEQQTNQIEALRAEWQREAERAQEELQSRLAETQETLSTSRAQLEQLQASRGLDLLQLEEELQRTRSERDSAARANADLVTSHQGALQEQEDRARRLEEVCSASAEREQQLQQQVERLQVEHVTLKWTSEQEMNHLRTELERVRVSCQELEGLREQLLARSAQVEELQRELSQQRRDIRQQNEAELENLRSYFEQRVRAAEESHREEVTLLQRRLAEGAEENAAPQGGNASFLFEGIMDEDKTDMLAEINMKLENHKVELDSLRLQLEQKHTREVDQLKASLALSYREELLQVKTDLADRYYSQIQELRSQHCLELEQQRAKLNSSHVKEISRLRLQCAQDAARQVERELEERGRALAEEHRARLEQARSEKGRIQSLEAQLASLQKGQEEQLKQAEERSGGLARKAQEKLKQDCAEQLRVAVLKAQAQEGEQLRVAVLKAQAQEGEQLRVAVLKAQAQEGERVLQEISREKEEELARVREELGAQAETRLSALREELERAAAEQQQALEEQVRALQEQLEEARRRQGSPEGEHDPRVLAVRRKFEAQFERELLTAKRHMAEEVKELNAVLLGQAEAKLQEVQRRFEQEQKEMEEKQEAALCVLTKKHSEELQSQKALLEGRIRSLEEDRQNVEERLKHKHGVELDSLRAELQAKHKAELDSLEAEFQAKHKAELDSLEAELRRRSQSQLEASEAVLRARLQGDRDELEARMLSNMDTLESAYLVQIQAVRDERDGALQALRDRERGHAAQLERLGAQHQAKLGLICIELRRELDLLMDKPSVTETQLNKIHKLSAVTSGLEEEPEKQREKGPEDVCEEELEGEPEEVLEEADFVDPGDRSGQELGGLFSKLTTDLRTVAEERRGLQAAHRKLQEVLLEVVRRTIATEEAIHQRLRAYTEPGVGREGETREKLTDSALWSVLTGEGQGLSQKLSESLLSGLGPEPEVEEVVLGFSTRLCSAVDRLLELSQLEPHPHGPQVHLEENLIQSREDSAPSELQEHRPSLQLHLHRVEKAALEEGLQQKELLEELQELQAELRVVREERALLLRQREALAEPLGDTEQALLEEAQRLLREKMEAQQQAEEDRSRLESQLRLMEVEVEERDSCRLEAEQERQAQVDDLQLQVRALEKQLRHHRHFIDEQAVEREQEREEFQQEIQKLEVQLRRASRPHTGGAGGEDKVENLQAAIRKKTEEYDQLLLTKEKYRGDVAEQNEQIHKMAVRICELEHALLTQSSDTLAQQDGVQDKEPLPQLQCSSCMQMFALQGNLDDPLHWPPEGGAGTPLNQQLQALQVELHTAGMGQVQVEHAGKDSDDELEEALLQKSTNQDLVAEEAQAEVEELRSQVEHLLSDRERLRQDREVEVERLHEVIHKLQEELERMGPARHEVSTSPECSPAPPLQHSPRGLEHSLRQELIHHTPEPRGQQEHTAHARAERGGPREGPSQRQAEDRLRKGHTPLPGAGPQVRWAEEGWEKQLAGSGGEEAVDESVTAETLQELVKALQAQVGEGRAKMHSLETEKEELRHSKAQLQAEVERLRQDVTSKRARSEHLNSRLGEKTSGAVGLREVLTMAEETLAKAEGALKENQTRLSQGKMEHDALKEEHSALEEAHRALKEEHSALEEAHCALKEEHSALEEKHGALKEEHSVLKEECVALKEEHSALEEHRALKEEHSALMEESVALKEEHSALEEEHGALKEEHDALGEEHDVLWEEHSALKKEHSALGEEHDALKAEHSALGEEHDALKAEHSALGEEHDALKEEHSALGEEHDALKAEHSALGEEHGALKAEHSALGEEHDALKAEHDILWAEHVSYKMKFAAVQEELISSTQRTEKLMGEGQTGNRALAELEIHSQHTPGQLLSPADQRGEPESCSLQYEDSPRSPKALHTPGSSGDPAQQLPSPLLSDLSSLLAQDSAQLPEAFSTPLSRSTSPSDPLSTRDSLHSQQVKTLDDRYFTGLEEWTSEGDASSVNAHRDSTQERRSAVGLSASFLDYLHNHDMSVAGDTSDSATESMGQDAELLSPELQSLLKRVYREGHRVLSLSERPAPVTETPPSSHQAPPLSWQAERRALQQTILSLRELLCKMAARETQPDSEDADLRRQLQQTIRSVFHSERAALCSELQAVMSTAGLQQLNPVMDQLEKLLKQQEEQRRLHLEQLLSADRHVLLGEVQDLHSLLSASSLRCQEQLHLLQASLSISQESSHHQHGELLEPYSAERQLGPPEQQAKQRAEGEEQKGQRWEGHTGGAEQKGQRWEGHTGGAEQNSTMVEKNAVRLNTTNEPHPELQSEVHKLRSRRESMETSQASQEAERREQLLQQSERMRSQRRCDAERQEPQELSLDMEEVEQEHADGGSSRLQREQSCCEVSIIEESSWASNHAHSLEEEVQRRHEALRQLEEERLSHAHSLEEEVQRKCEVLKQLEEDRASHAHSLKEEVQRRHEVLRQLEEERASHAHSLEEEVQRRHEVLRQLEEESVSHACSLEEQARQHEEVVSHERRFLQELQAQLEQERRQSEELAAAMERLHRQAIRTKRQLEEETQRRCEAVHREREAGLGLQEQRRRADQLQAQLDLLREKERCVKKERRTRGRQEEQEETERKQSTVHRLLKSPDCVALSEKLSLQNQSAALQSDWRNAETELQLTADITNQPFNSKMRRLYCRFLRAESYRKALVFQKRYLLLLLGGVQDGEQMTLALVASMGACPSPVAPPPQPSPISRFRTAALTAIAISRLSFLVRKWRRAFRIGPSESAHTSEPRSRADSCIKAEVPRRQQLSAVQNSFPTNDSQPHTRGRGQSFVPVRQVTLQPVQQVV